MKALTLSAEDFRRASRAAASLAIHWIEKDPTRAGREKIWRQTLNGICGELAVVRCIESLGYQEPIAFNGWYDSPGDGGFDFVFEGMKCDAKLVKAGAGIPRAHISGKADLYFLAWNAGAPRAFAVVGWAPYSRLKDLTGEIGPAAFRDVEQLKACFPKKFHANGGPEREVSKLEKAGAVLGGMLGPMVIKSVISEGL